MNHNLKSDIQKPHEISENKTNMTNFLWKSKGDL